ncbi:MAG: hypothetical protein AAGA67_04810 [Cyanobacteria bacterium P01_F01_bin.153]
MSNMVSWVGDCDRRFGQGAIASSRSTPRIIMDFACEALAWRVL